MINQSRSHFVDNFVLIHILSKCNLYINSAMYGLKSEQGLFAKVDKIIKKQQYKKIKCHMAEE